MRRLKEGDTWDVFRAAPRCWALLGLVAVIATGGSASGAVTHHGFRQINLVSDIPGKAQLTDSHLVNPWGLAAGPTSPLWVADNGTDVATLYSGAVHGSPVSQVPLIVSIPGGAPTGQVFNPTNGFKLRVGDMRLPARFIFDSEAGTITAWTPTDPLQTTARTKLTVPGAVFKGLALSFFDHHPALYATDFTHDRVVVVDSHFHRVATPGMFEDAMCRRGSRLRDPGHRPLDRRQLRQARAGRHRRGARRRTGFRGRVQP